MGKQSTDYEEKTVTGKTDRVRVPEGHNKGEIARMLRYTPVRFMQEVIFNIRSVRHRYANLTQLYARIAIDLSRTDNPKPKGTPYVYNTTTLRAMRAQNGVGKWKGKPHKSITL